MEDLNAHTENPLGEVYGVLSPAIPAFPSVEETYS